MDSAIEATNLASLNSISINPEGGDLEQHVEGEGAGFITHEDHIHGLQPASSQIHPTTGDIVSESTPNQPAGSNTGALEKHTFHILQTKEVGGTDFAEKYPVHQGALGPSSSISGYKPYYQVASGTSSSQHHHHRQVSFGNHIDQSDETNSEKPSMDSYSHKHYQELTIPECLSLLKTSEEGLSSSEADHRIFEFGPNKLPDTEQNPVFQFLKFMWNPLSWAMEIACIIAIVFLDYLDFVFILLLLLVNSSIGFYEERKAQRAIRELRNNLEPRAKVYRDHELKTTEARNLVPGDIILLKFGDIIPADVKLINLDETLLVDQSSMTGESLPAKKNKGDFCFGGTSVKQGESKAAVCRTGLSTEQNKSFSIVSSEEHVGNLTKVMNHIGAVCLGTIAVWTVIELFVQFFRYGHTCKMGLGNCPTMINTLVIIIGGIPIAMPTVLSITLALGGSMMARQGAIVTRLTAIEEIAGMDILCSDKTGTLTLNRLSVNKHSIFSGWKSSAAPKPPVAISALSSGELPKNHEQPLPKENFNINTQVHAQEEEFSNLEKYSVDEVLYYGAVSSKIENEEPIDICLHNSFVEHVYEQEKIMKKQSALTRPAQHQSDSEPQYSRERLTNIDEDNKENIERVQNAMQHRPRSEIGDENLQQPMNAASFGMSQQHDKLESMPNTNKNAHVNGTSNNDELGRKHAGKQLWKSISCAKYIPFNPTSKKTIAYIKDPNCDSYNVSTMIQRQFQSQLNNGKPRYYRVSKGAPQVILKDAYNYEQIRHAVDERVIDFANHGYRSVGIGLCEGWDCELENEHHEPLQEADRWIFVGLVPLMDPPRHDTKETINKCLSMGIGVKMITGDQLPIGIETARLLGMGTDFHTPEVLESESPSGLVENTIHLEDLIANADGFAEVFPEHKYMVVKKLQEQGHIVGMTGDGVNDAPALKKADIGIAVAGATEAARAAADFVLTQEGLSVIIAAVIESRKIFQRMKSYAQYTVASTIRTCFTFGLLTVIYNWYFPATLVVVLAVLNDGAMISLSRDRSKAFPLPEAWFLKRMFITGFFYGVYLTFTSWLFFYLASEVNWFASTFGVKSTNFVDLYAIREACANKYGLEPLTEAWSLCISQQTWTRASVLRAVFYLELSISSQSLIFVTRSRGFSFLDRPGWFLLGAFAVAQLIASFICAYGLNGFEYPSDPTACLYCDGWTGGKGGPSALSGKAESLFAASVLPAGWGWVLIAWVYALIWYLPLDLIKLTLGYIWSTDNRHFVQSLFPDSVRPSANSARPSHHRSGDIESGRRSTGRAPRASQVIRESIY